MTQWEAYRDDVKAGGDTVAWLRALSSWMGEKDLDSVTAETSIMIAPGFRWRIVDGMVTNFHQPKSTLLLLVSSFLGDDAEGRPRWKSVYEEALRGDYRFLSYGDACFFSR